MPAITWNYTAVNCPVPPSAGGLLDPYAAAPDTVLTLHDYINLGDVLEGLQKHNRNTIRQEAAARFGSGARCVVQGLGLAWTTGLTGIVEDGTAMLDGPAVLPTDESILLPDSTARICCYIEQDTDILQDTTTLNYPSGITAFLGSFKTAGGVVTEIDHSGRLIRLPGGLLYRRTADLGMPGDAGSLPGDLMLMTRTRGGLYLWDGSAYYGLTQAESPWPTDHLNNVMGWQPFTGGLSNLTWPAANRAFFTAVKARTNVTVTKLDWRSGTSPSGNYDVGIYDSAFNRLWSKGSTAAPGAATVVTETISPSLDLQAGQVYYLGIAWDNNTSQVSALVVTNSAQLRDMDSNYHLWTVDTSFPLPATTAYSGTAATQIPWMALRK